MQTLQDGVLKLMTQQGLHLQLSTTGIFLRSIAQCFGNPTLSHDFLALLKHPLTHSGKGRNIHNLMAMEIEVGQFNGTKILRGGPPFIDFDLLSGWAAKDPSKEIWVTMAFKYFPTTTNCKRDGVI